MSTPTTSAAVLRSPIIPETEQIVSLLAHELRQPLSTIESIAYYLELSLPKTEGKLLDQVRKLRELVAQSDWILSDAVQLARTEPSDLEIVDLDELIVHGLSEESGIDAEPARFALHLNGGPVWLDFAQARHLLHNLFRYFHLVSRPDCSIAITTRLLASGNVLLAFKCEGTAHDPAGTCFSLAALRHVAEKNGCTIFIDVAGAGEIQIALEIPSAPYEDEVALQCS